MRAFPMLTVVAVCAGAALSACAATGQGQPTYGERLDRLSADCAARGGILASSGANQGRPETDNLCRIAGGATRIERQD